MIKSIQLSVFASLMLLGGCTFVDLNEGGEKVRILEAHEVTKCKLLGKTTATTKEKALGVRRHDKAINHELVSLARNAAADLKGDTIVAEGEESGGKQTFSIYRCVPQ
jgi:hypothetical protein